MLTILKPKSFQAQQEIERFGAELRKAGLAELPNLVEAEEVDGASRILTWNSREEMRLRQAFPNAAVVRLEPGVDTRIRTLREEPRPYDVLRIVTTLDISQENGFDQAVRLLQEIGESEWHWYIVGEPMDEYYFEALTMSFERWGWDDKVTFVGNFPLDERIRLYMNMDLALHLPRESPLGFALTEYVQMGLPVLTTPVGFAEELLAGDEEALITKDGTDAKAFLLRYAGRSETRRKKRDHPLLRRKWSQVVEDYRALSAGIPSD